MNGRVAGARLRRLIPNGDQGIVAIWTALLMVVFLGAAAIAVDIARWYVEAERVQKTVDAAALAGAVYLPGDLTGARRSADEVITANGWTLSSVTRLGEPGATPSQFKVTMTSTVSNAFGAVLGVPTTRITRTATADYAPPLAMGSPCNVFGTEPGTDKWASPQCPTTTGKYWVNIAGPNTNKARGDAYATRYCSASEAADAKADIDKCDPIPARNVTGVGPTKQGTYTNQEYDSDGYIFIVRAKAAGQLQLQGYDVDWGGSNDLSMGQPWDDKTTIKTVVTVRRPGPDAWSPLRGQVLCTLTIDGANPAFSDKWANLTEPRAGLTQNGSGGPCATSIAVGAGQDYSIQVQTVAGGGMNHFALRAKLGAGTDQENSNVSIFAHGRVSIFTNDAQASPTFKFVRLDSSAAGRTLVVRLYDLGDVSGGDKVTATMLQPDSDTAFSDCAGSGTVSGTLNGCSVSLREEENSGRWQEIAIKVPSSYRCADADQSKCWVRVRLDPAVGSQIYDITTWSAHLRGLPVRIIA